jgi:cysteine desulfurase
MISSAPVYLDCNSTTPLEPAVADLMHRFFVADFGNEGSRTHTYGAAARQAVQRARDQVAAVVRAKRDEVVFTSGATESNNIALLGLAAFGDKSNRRHIVTTAIEHKAVLEPLEHLAQRGFEVTRIGCDRSGRVAVDQIRNAVRSDTLLVSVMHVNNETGIEQPIAELCNILKEHPAYLHVDAAQGFGKRLDALMNPRIDLISISAHKVYGPKGVGALITRRREYDRPPLEPLAFGGGQERGLRPGTIPVPLVVGFGLACELALKFVDERNARNKAFRETLFEAFAPFEPVIHGDQSYAVPHTVNLRFPGIDAEALMVALKEVVAVSNGSACTSHNYSLSHVLTAMGLGSEEIAGAVRISWCHLTPDIDWPGVVQIIRSLH